MRIGKISLRSALTKFSWVIFVCSFLSACSYEAGLIDWWWAKPTPTKTLYEECVLAHGGDGRAQIEMGNYFRFGWDPVEQDEVEAYKWYLLADHNPNQSSIIYLRNLSEALNDDEILSAQNRARQFAPDADECTRYQ